MSTLEAILLIAFLLFAGLVIKGRYNHDITEEESHESWRGDCFYCDGFGCRYCDAGWQPWCQMIDSDDPDGETICAKCLGGKVNSMGNDCPQCSHFPKGINAPFHERWISTP